MNNKAFNVSLSLTENNYPVVKGLVQYDTGNLLRIKVMSGDEPFDFTNYSNIILTILKPDRTTIIEDITTESDSVQVINPETGDVFIQLDGQSTLLVGMHYLALSFYGDGLRTTTAKLNYYVSETDDSENIPDDIQSSDNWKFLIQLLAKNSLIETAESERIIAEQARATAETERASEYAGLVALANQILAQAQAYATQAGEWAAAAFATALPNGDYWSLVEDDDGNLYIEYDEELFPDGFVLPTITEAQLNARLAAIDCGEFDDPIDKIQILRGLFEDIPTLDEGEMAWATDTQILYVGTTEGNQPAGKSGHIAQATAPDDHSVLWIDTANGNVIKFWDGDEWVSTSQATFA